MATGFFLGRRGFLAALAFFAAAVAQADDRDLKSLAGAAHRTPAFVQRDGARRPVEVLGFIGLRPDATVVEISPGGGYWTEILAPYLRERGKLMVATAPAEALKGRPAYEKARAAFLARLAGEPELYGKVVVTDFARGWYDVAPAGSADFVLTFRNVHNWMAAGFAEAALEAFHRALKPGGILGVADHRAAADRPQDPAAKDGYVREDFMIEMARRAGFEFAGRSDLLANQRDTRDHPEGVWTLPPTLRLGEKDRAKYLAIGEADNFLLRFRKPR